MSGRRVTRSNKGKTPPLPPRLTQAQIDAGVAPPAGPCNMWAAAGADVEMPSTDPPASVVPPDESPNSLVPVIRRLEKEYLPVLGTDCVAVMGSGDDLHLSIAIPRALCTVTVQMKQPTIKMVHPLGGHPITGNTGGCFTYTRCEWVPDCVYNEAADLVDRCIEHGRKYGTRGLEQIDGMV